jgi:cytochrome bd-type quinol oxidase subunit 1
VNDFYLHAILAVCIIGALVCMGLLAWTMFDVSWDEIPEPDDSSWKWPKR